MASFQPSRKVPGSPEIQARIWRKYENILLGYQASNIFIVKFINKWLFPYLHVIFFLIFVTFFFQVADEHRFWKEQDVQIIKKIVTSACYSVSSSWAKVGWCY